MRAAPLAVSCLVVLVGCKEQDAPSRERAAKQGAAGQEQAFVARSVADLRAALAARDEGGVMTGCVVADGSAGRIPAELAAEVARLCGVEAPTLYLDKAIASVKEGLAKSPDLRDLACMQLFVEDALRAIAAHPSSDAKLQGLVDEYGRLCPAELAKARAKAAGQR